MNWFTGVVLYLLIWWIALFAVLPWGTRPLPDPDSATGWRGAPDRPRIGLKVLMTTLVAAVIWGLCYLLISSPWLSFRSGWLAISPTK
jgi:predicted secreted protein